MSLFAYATPSGLGIRYDEKHVLQYVNCEARESEHDLLLEKIKVEVLRSKDVRQGAQTLFEAAQDDPLFIYIREAPDARNGPFQKRMEKLQFAVGVKQWARKKIGLTVDHGRAVVCAVPPESLKDPSNVDRALDRLASLLVKLISLISLSKIQRKREKAAIGKMNKFIQDILGDEAKEMRLVEALATAPAFQRRGYGGALVDAISAMADKEGRSTYLLSSNPINTEFYNSHGFFAVGEVILGDDDPTWQRPPLAIPLMIREYKGSGMKLNEKVCLLV